MPSVTIDLDDSLHIFVAIDNFDSLSEYVAI